MTAGPAPQPEIAIMDGPSALPRKSGELVFHDDWERRAFAIAVSLAGQGAFEWRDFQRHLIKAIAEAERDNPRQPGRGYYESWLIALEAMLQDRQIVTT